MAVQATNAGIDFQQRVSALMMICMEFEIDIDLLFGFQTKDKIQKLNFEASDKIDDLVITTYENKKIYLQMKRNISFSIEETSEFYGVCGQFVKQYCENNQNDFAYVLVTRTQSSKKLTIKLKRILEGIRLSNSIDIKEDLNVDEIQLLEDIESNIQKEYAKIKGMQISKDILTKILCKFHVEVFDLEDGESFEKNIKLILYSKLNVDVNLFWKMLISMAVQYGANRRCLDNSYLHEQVKDYIDSNPDSESIIEMMWESQQTEVEVQKDYVIAFGNNEFKEIIGGCNLDKETIFIMELYRFDKCEKKQSLKYVAPNVMKWANGLSFEIIFRCSTHSRLQQYIESGGLRQYKGDNTEIILLPIKNEVEEDYVEKAYKELIKKSIESQKECRCINCGKAIFHEEAYLIEIDNIECSEKAGIIHKECLRPVDRLLGITKMPNTDQYTYMKNFDVNQWLKLILKGKRIWENIDNLKQKISPLVIDTDEVFTDGKYCVRSQMNNGAVRYATHRGAIHRMSKIDAEDFASQLSVLYKKAQEEHNPICYTSETYVHGPYNQLLLQVNGKEDIVECVNAEVAIYNDTIAKMYNECNTYYTPIIYLSVEGDPVIFNGIFPLITNPLELNYYVNNWKRAGVVIKNYEVNIIGEDNDFMLKILSLILNGIRPVVNPIISQDKNIIMGCIIQTLKEKLNMYSMKDDASLPLE